MSHVETEPIRLTDTDNVWIEPIRGGVADRSWLSVGTLIANIGDQNMQGRSPGETRDQVTDSRRFFYGEMLGMADASNPFHGLYSKLFEGERTEMGVRTGHFISTNRILTGEGIPPREYMKYVNVFTRGPVHVEDTIALIKSTDAEVKPVFIRYPGVIQLALETTGARIDNLGNIVEHPNVAITNDGRVLSGTTDHVRRHGETIEKSKDELGLNGDLSEFMEHAPILLYSSGEKLDAILLLMKDHGQYDDARGAARLANFAPSRLVLCIMDGEECNPTNAWMTYKRYPRAQAAARFNALLKNPARLISRLGHEAFDALVRAEAVKQRRVPALN